MYTGSAIYKEAKEAGVDVDKEIEEILVHGADEDSQKGNDRVENAGKKRRLNTAEVEKHSSASSEQHEPPQAPIQSLGMEHNVLISILFSRSHILWVSTSICFT